MFSALLFLEGILRLICLHDTIKFILFAQPDRKSGICEYDENLGWKNRANFSSNLQWPYRTTLEKINSKGLRDKECDFEKKENVFRIAAIGCSRTYGFGVNMEATYSKELERMLNDKYEKNFEVINFGVNGYGLCQMTLNYIHNARRYSPDIVIVQFYSASVIRVSQRKMWAAQKPVYRMIDGRLALVNVSVPEDRFRPAERWLFDHSYFYKIFKNRILRVEEDMKLKLAGDVATNQELHHLCSKILAYLNEQVKDDGSRLIVLIWGGKIEWIESILNEAGVEYFWAEDFGDYEKWAKMGEVENPPPTGHWSPIGHKFVAESVLNYLSTHVLVGGEGF